MSVDSVLVVGATGTQGGAVARHLLERGVEVHALTRSPDGEAATDLSEAGAAVVEGDLDDRERLETLVSAVDGVYCVTTWDEGIETEIERGTRTAEVAADAGVDLFVFSSVTGARDSGVDVFESKGEIEAAIADLDVSATVVRPAYFMQNLEREREAVLDGTLSIPLERGNALQMVDVDDIGAMVATAFANPNAYAGETIELASDELTLEGIGARMADVLDLDLTVEHVSVADYRDAAGDRYGDMYRYLNDEGAASITDLRATHDVDFSRLETYLERAWP
ncbi:NmrA/HSCARG family protein [Haloarculaceae archaeon H-GB11]|nr:NmrA/HSCARG family protein [Haloarculaceae archaeon H-GB1-1]MEA5386144.1 NmrA/HSCARG family protein [Haloarculaceae archaeon H-GB11]